MAKKRDYNSVQKRNITARRKFGLTYKARHPKTTSYKAGRLRIKK